jgi:hypothetical protein
MKTIRADLPELHAQIKQLLKKSVNSVYLP